MRPRPLIPNELRAVRLIEAERRRVESWGARGMVKVGRAAFRHAAAALRLGHDPIAAARAVVMGDSRIGQPGMAPILSQMMTVAYLRGRRRVALESSAIPALTSLSRQSDERERLKTAEKILLILLFFAERDANELRRRSDIAAQAAVAAFWDSLKGKLDETVGELRESGLPNLQTIATGPDLRYGIPGVQTAPIVEAESESGGIGIRTAIRELGGAFARSGILPEHSHGAEAIAGTAGVRSYETGRMEGYAAPAVAVKLWGWRYVAILDNRTTVLCRTLNDTQLPQEHPFWKQWTPPNHWGCRSTILPIWHNGSIVEPPSVENFKKFKNFYMG